MKSVTKVLIGVVVAVGAVVGISALGVDISALAASLPMIDPHSLPMIDPHSLPMIDPHSLPMIDPH